MTSSRPAPLSPVPPPRHENLAARSFRHRYGRFAAASETEWNDWRWQMKNAVSTVDELKQLLPLSDDEIARIEKTAAQWHFQVPPYYFSLIDPDDPFDPVRLQSLPHPDELARLAEDEGDPLDEDADAPVHGLTHRYPDRVLFVTTSFCSMYCRHCMRKRHWQPFEPQKNAAQLEQMVAYIAAHDEVRDVLVSGGDPLMLADEPLFEILRRLAAIPHLEVIRIGTRVPVNLPQKITADYAARLAAAAQPKALWINTHFNHPREITPEAASACDILLKAGMPVNNQAVLLKGINDDGRIIKKLCTDLLRIKVRPVYLFHCDPIRGATHFRTSVRKGIEIIEFLRGHLSGFAIPTYAVDAPGGGGKIPVHPNTVISWGEGHVVLRNFEGMLVSVPDGDPPAGASESKPSTPYDSVANLTQSPAILIPQGNKRLARRVTTSEDGKVVPLARGVHLPIVDE